jgi:multicomponent Na+:H+ antiporter subunit D
VLIAGTLLNAAYFLPIVHAAFFRPAKTGATHGEAPRPMVFALLVTAAATLALPFLADVPIALTGMLVGAVSR